jgi:hypothetical protein
MTNRTCSPTSTLSGEVGRAVDPAPRSPASHDSSSPAALSLSFSQNKRLEMLTKVFQINMFEIDQLEKLLRYLFHVFVTMKRKKPFWLMRVIG